MAQVIITFKIMPTSPEEDLDRIKDDITKMIAEFGGEVGKVEIEPVAFGLNALLMIFVMEESLGSTQDLEDQIAKVAGVNSIEVSDIRRAIG